MRGFGGVSSLCSEKVLSAERGFSSETNLLDSLLFVFCVFCVGQTLRELGKHSVVYTVLNFTHKEPPEIEIGRAHV